MKIRRKLMDPWPSSMGLGLWVTLFVLSVTCFLADSASTEDCRNVRFAYSSKGLELKDVPRQPRPGANLQTCPSGPSCCTEDMERKLKMVSKDQYMKAIKMAGSNLSKMFNSKAKKFDEFFSDLLYKSKLKFHKLFQQTYGIIYERNSDVFANFFKDLENYYETGKVNLEEALKSFFSQLYQRMFTVFNAQHTFEPAYLTCVSHTMKKLHPFGDVPRQLSEQLRRSFVATRTFTQALTEGKQILNKILKIGPKDDCQASLLKMYGCQTCRGISGAKTCKDFCLNVMKGCLAFHWELEEHWEKFIDNLQILADRMIGPFDVEAVVDPIGLKISDAIMNFQGSGFEVTAKVFQDCGTPKLQKRQVSYEPRQSRKGSTVISHSADDYEDAKLKTIIREIKEAIVGARRFWSQLPNVVCQDDYRTNGDPNLMCWNGSDIGAYKTKVVSEGLRKQESNPEVRVDISRPDVYINEQIFSLKLITKKIESAHKGQNIEYPHTNGAKVFMSDKAESSGDGCDPDSDDEDDCNDDDRRSGYEDDEDEEGSGSGDGTNNNHVPTRPKNHGNNKHVEEEETEEHENWPPWMTTSKPHQSLPENFPQKPELQQPRIISAVEVNSPSPVVLLVLLIVKIYLS